MHCRRYVVYAFFSESLHRIGSHRTIAVDRLQLFLLQLARNLYASYVGRYHIGFTMENFDEKLEQGSADELQELKAWLFQENIRIATAAKELEDRQEQFQKEKVQFQDEMKHLNRKISSEQKRLKENNIFFAKKMEILQNGFQQLDLDRRRLDKERARVYAEKELLYGNVPYEGGSFDVSVFFQGVNNPLALKKRYKDLIKIFHPDNLAGDKDVIQRINREYESLKKEYENFKQA